MTVVVTRPSQAGKFERISFMPICVCGGSARNALKRPTTTPRPRHARNCSITTSYNHASADGTNSTRCALCRLTHYQQKHKKRHTINYDGARAI